MSHELPENHSKWPEDSFELLGVKPGAPEVEIRRAYTRLIRKYKPEHHPEEFRKIREAYENAKMRTHWYHDNDTDETENPTSEATDSSNNPAATSVPNDATPVPVPSADLAERLWQVAIEGDLATAYRQLLPLAEARADVCLRLYWLLATDPKLDETLTRHHWLAQALKLSRLQSPAQELYRRELNSNPVSAFDVVYQDLLTTPAEYSDLLTFARNRLTEAGRTRRFDQIQWDTQHLRIRLAIQQPVLWFGYLDQLGDWLTIGLGQSQVDPEVVSQHHQLQQQLKLDLKALKDLELQYPNSFDKHEMNAVLAEHFLMLQERLQGASRELFLQASVGYWNVPRFVVFSACRGITKYPRDYFKTLDYLIKNGQEPLVQSASYALAQHRHNTINEDAPEYPPEYLRDLARRYQNESTSERRRYRWLLLRLLVQEGVSPGQFAAACREDTWEVVRAMAADAENDLPLRFVWQAFALLQFPPVPNNR
ncbi:MAG: J domain-containing protein [Gemmataceae bacterium]